MLFSAEVLAKAKLPQVMVSIKPLALILSEAFGDLLPVTTLLPANADPHNISLSIAQRQRLQEAEVFVWLGPELEPHLRKAVAALPAARVLRVDSSARIEWLAVDESEHTHEGGRDLHFWLAPANAQAVVALFADYLSQHYPTHQKRISDAVKRSQRSLLSLDKDLSTQLAPYSERAFMVYHDAYQYFVRHFHLTQVAAVNKLPQQRLSAGKMAELLKQAKRAACLVADQPGRAVEQLAQRLELPAVYIDPVASSAQLTRYSAFMRSVADAFVQCVKA